MRSALLLLRAAAVRRSTTRGAVSLAASALTLSRGAAAMDLVSSAGGTVRDMSASGASNTRSVPSGGSGATVGAAVVGTTVLGAPGYSDPILRRRMPLAAGALAPTSGWATLAMRVAFAATGVAVTSGAAVAAIPAGPRVNDDFVARSLDTSKWRTVLPSLGSGGGVAFTAASMIDLISSNYGSYRDEAATWLVENVTPDASSAQSDITVQFTIPSQTDGTFRIATRVEALAPYKRGYYMIFDNGNRNMGMYRVDANNTNTELFRNPVNTYPGATTGAVWKMRLLTQTTAVGKNRLAGKMWLASGSEPAGWSFDVTDSVTGWETGYNAIQAYPGASAANYTWKMDSAVVVGPTSGTGSTGGSTGSTGGQTSTNAIDFANLWKPPQQVDNQVGTYPELAPIANTPQARWTGEQTTKSDVQGWTASAGTKTKVIVIYAIPGRDNGLYSSGGFSNRQAYLNYCTAMRDAVGSTPTVFILEPDALGLSEGISDSNARAERIETLRQAVAIFGAAPSMVETYIDASQWITPTRQVQLLQSVGVANIAGIVVNVSGYEAQSSCYSYANDVLNRLSAAGTSGKKFLVDSSRNGNGPLTTAYGSVGTPWFNADRTWCNPPGRAVGLAPGTVSDQALCRATLWIKNPGESDGTFPTTSQSNYYGENAPNAGVFWLPLARSLLGLSPTGGTASGGGSSSTASSITADFDSTYGSFTDKSSGVSLVGGRARIVADTTYANLSTPGQYTLKGGSVYARLYAPSATGATSGAMVQFPIHAVGQPDGTRINVEINTYTGKLTIANDSGYYDANAVQITYDATAHAWIRWRESNGTVYLDTSPDKSTWTTRRSFATPSWLTSTANQIFQFVAYKDAGAAAYAEIDNVNV